MKSDAFQNQAHIPACVFQHLNLLQCPNCTGSIEFSSDLNGINCAKCNHSFSVQDGIPLLFWESKWKSGEDVTNQIKAFYEKTPFPDYDDLDSSTSLREKAEKGIFARLLDRQIPPGTMILEAGCGTGQLSNFLGLADGRTVFGADLSLSSLRLAKNFRIRNEIDNVAFFQMNLFKPIFKPESFHFVICNGVLHHTSNPRGGFESLLKLVKKGGFIIIGLYHTYGRIWTDFRRVIFNATQNRFKFLDARLRQSNSEKKKNAWFMDQYKNPHESKHTINEVLKWFDDAGVEFINSIPKCVSHNGADENLFARQPRGTFLERFVRELLMAINGAQEGGFFMMIGRRKV